jgi:uncharacterized protein
MFFLQESIRHPWLGSAFCDKVFNRTKRERGQRPEISGPLIGAGGVKIMKVKIMKKIVSAAAAALAVCLLPQAAFSQVQTSGSVRSVTVTGTCIRSTLPDRGAVTVVADVLAQNLQEASKKSTEQYEAVRKAVQKLNLKDLELSTSESSFQEEREWRSDKSVFKGFRARLGLRVSTSETSRLGEVIAIAAKQNIRQVSGLSMFLSPEKTKVERESCLEEAVRNARAKAETVAKAASAKIGRVLTVTEGVRQEEVVRPFGVDKRMAMGVAEDASQAPMIETAAEKISVEVVASFGLD